MESCTFPLIPPADLVNFFQLNVLSSAEAKSFTKNDLYPKPKLEWVQKIFMRVLQQVFNISMDQFYMVPVGVEIQFPQLVEGFAPLGYIVKLMSRLLSMCLVHGFHPSDVLNPKGKQTVHLLSGIVNFLRFRDVRKEIYSSFCLSYKSALETMNQQQRTIQELEAKIEKLTTIPPEQQAEFQALSTEIQNLQQIISQEYRTKDMAFQDKLSQKKVDLGEKNKKLKHYKLAIATMKEEQETMKSQIVESPEQRKNKTERMKENVQKVKLARRETNEKYEHYRERVVLAGLWLPDVQAYSKKLQCIEANMEMYRKIREEISQEEDQNVKGDRELKAVYAEEQQLKWAIVKKKEKLAKMDIKNQKKQEEFEQRKKEILEICSRFQEKRQALVGRVSHVLNEIQQTNCKKEQLLEMAEGEKMLYQEMVVSFRTALEKYQDGLQRTFDRSAERKREKLAELNRRLSRR